MVAQQSSEVPGTAGYDYRQFEKTRVNPNRVRKCSLCGLDQTERTMITDHRNGKYFCSDRKSCWSRFDAQNDLQEVIK